MGQECTIVSYDRIGCKRLCAGQRMAFAIGGTMVGVVGATVLWPCSWYNPSRPEHRYFRRGVKSSPRTLYNDFSRGLSPWCRHGEQKVQRLGKHSYKQKTELNSALFFVCMHRSFSRVFTRCHLIIVVRLGRQQVGMPPDQIGNRLHNR
jgi:hypothetical protein